MKRYKNQHYEKHHYVKASETAIEEAFERYSKDDTSKIVPFIQYLDQYVHNKQQNKEGK